MQITTFAVIAFALGQAAFHAPTKNAGWYIEAEKEEQAKHLGTATQQPIMFEHKVGLSTENVSFAAPSNIANRLDLLRGELEGYQSLQSNWDGFGSISPEYNHIAAAISLLDKFPAGIPLPKTMLSRNGEVGYYWRDSRWLADIVIEDSNTFSLFIRFFCEGNPELFLESVCLDEAASGKILSAFQAH